MIGPVETKFKELVAGAAAWPVRWANGAWPTELPLGDGNMPLGALGEPAPAIEAEVISDWDTAAIAPQGESASQRHGLLRLYLSVQQGIGTDAINVEVDRFITAFKRKRFVVDSAIGQYIVTMYPRVDDGVAGYEEGNRYCRMVSVPWWFDYIS